MKYTVRVIIGTPLWSQAVNDFELGSFRWLWRAKLAAWWHILNHPFREAYIPK